MTRRVTRSHKINASKEYGNPILQGLKSNKRKGKDPTFACNPCTPRSSALVLAFVPHQEQIVMVSLYNICIYIYITILRPHIDSTVND